MQLHTLYRVVRIFSLLALGCTTLWGLHPSRGLWVGEVALNAVNEATGAVGDSNTYEFTDPEIMTPTSDTAYLRLILHVNGVGQVHLLKSVALVDSGDDVNGVDRILLISNPDLYPNYPGIAKRIASAFFDFGDPQGTGAVQELIDQAVSIAVTEVQANKLASEIEATVMAALDDVVSNANVDKAYFNPGTGTSFVTDDFFDRANVLSLADAIADRMHNGNLSPADFAYTDQSVSYNPFLTAPLASTLAGVFNGVVTAAEDLRNLSTFYQDTRGIDAIVNLVAAAARAVEAQGSATLAEKEASARLAALAEWHNAADLEQAYNRYISSSDFALLPDTLVDTAVQNAISAEQTSTDAVVISDAVEVALKNLSQVSELGTEAGNIAAASHFGDTRPQMALDSMIDAATNAAATQVLISNDLTTLREIISQALVTAQETIQPAPVFASAPTSAYNAFVTGSGGTSDYSEAAALAAETAASEAKFQFDAGEDDPARLAVLIENAVNKALSGYRNQVAAMPRNEVALVGGLESGGEVSGSFVLPARAPSNPFLHRLHPDHGSGIEITRKILLEVDTPEGPGLFSSAGYGVSLLTGTYTEELFGLHKPLGANQDLGLKTQGSFILNRLTLADTLNF